ncbi:MAG: hypothetical protein P1V20_06320 [Verrucomicrobiales bacterium]|nr:hypothetical protein [Verrucomicrobiales bacterium]
METIQSSLGGLKSAGSVFGVILSREDSVIYSDVPFQQDRVNHVVTVLDDIGFYFKKENRRVDQLAFGYDGGNIVVVIDESYRLVVFHSLNDEIDFIAKAAKAFLIDYQMGLFAAEFEQDLNQARALEAVSPEPRSVTPEEVKIQEPLRPGTQRITLQAEKGFDKTEPLQPRTQRPVTTPSQATATAQPRPRARRTI